MVSDLMKQKTDLHMSYEDLRDKYEVRRREEEEEEGGERQRGGGGGGGGEEKPQ